MPISIRSRLLLLLMSVLLPAMAGALWVVFNTFRAEQRTMERGLRDTANALSMVVDRELAQRTAIARTLSMSAMLDNAPSLTKDQLIYFDSQARHALQGLGGWVELHSEQGLLLSTRYPPGMPGPAPTGASAPAALAETEQVGALARDPANGEWRASVVAPVRRAERMALNLVVTILPIELQQIVDRQRLPHGWVATVIDAQGVVVARFPGGSSYIGRSTTPDLKAQLAAKREGLFQSTSLDGEPVTGYFSTSPQGWTFVTAVPRSQLAGHVPAAVMQLLAVGAVLAGVAIFGARWLSRRIVQPVVALKNMAERMQAGLPVQAEPTGIEECDKVANALEAAAYAQQRARGELERQVNDAIARTRDAEQRASHNQRVEALGRLTGGVAHDVNNLLGVISNSAYLIERRNHDGQLDLDSPLAATMRAVEAGRRLTQHLLRFAGRHATRPERVDLVSALPDLRELLGIVLGKRIGVEVKVAPDTRAVVVDAGELELALINLALNARDAMPNGGHLWLEAGNAGPTDTTELPAGAYVLITVSDDGSGISDEVANRAFEPFFTTKAAGLGSGLGLSQVHGFCTEAGGSARIAGTPGMGTAVTLVLPAAPATAAAPARQRSADAGAMAGLRVLVVEDNESLGDVTAALLGSYGCQVHLARSAEQALTCFDGGEPPFDAVLSDIVMPGGMDGVTLARQLRVRYPQLPLVLISGYSNVRPAQSEFTVLTKPCSPDDLVGALKRAVAAKA